ncbi:hypothetical protein WR25_04616 [Diploscapter pachys]|uniref:Uncharacterized protein n=1 Tax=Diploscapter pachys TaxID=2018661 RepID=A0A2A2LKS2_9BILA|nr:hypothetical protein WR25_04616 [Diploscapter pachys]
MKKRRTLSVLPESANQNTEECRAKQRADGKGVSGTRDHHQHHRQTGNSLEICEVEIAPTEVVNGRADTDSQQTIQQNAQTHVVCHFAAIRQECA